MRPEDIARTWATGPVKAVRLLVGGSINPAFRVQSTAGPFHLRAYRSPDRAR